MWKLIVLLACIGIVKAHTNDYSTNELEEVWKTFKLEYTKNYTHPNTEVVRYVIFMENREKIAKHNELYSKGNVSFARGINEFSDMTYAEFQDKYCGAQPPSLTELNSTIPLIDYVIPANMELPVHVDWTHRGAVTYVKHQGACESCWAFSTTGSLEGQAFRKTGRLVSLSEQNLIDCSKGYGNNGCHKGFMDKAFLYIVQNGGINTEQSYPYNARDDYPCRFNANTIGATATGIQRVPTGDERALMWAVATVGPISAAVHATESFMQYSHGVYFEPNCDANMINHAILIVGYGTDLYNGDFWIVKNSFGTGWGQGGFIRMARNRNNNCGIASWALFPQV